MGMFKRTGSALLTVASVIAVVGCSSSEPAKTAAPPSTGTETKALAAAPAPSNEPVTLSILFDTGVPTDAEFDEIYIKPLKQKYPNITLQRVTGKIDEMVAAKTVPDIIYSFTGRMYVYDNLKILQDMTPLAKKQGFDITRIDPVVLDSIYLTKPGQLTAIPFAMNFGALYYNTDLFDKFGVSYPSDGLTWDQTIDIGKRLTRMDGGVQYRGFHAYGLTRMQRVIGNTYYDPKTLKGTLTSPEWKYIFDTFMKIYTIPGNETKNPPTDGGDGPFMKEKVLAMLASNNYFPQLEVATKEGLNWDVAQFPSLPQRPNVFTDVDAHQFVIPNTSKNMDAAMQAVATFTSDDVQLLGARKYTKLSGMKDPKFKQQLGADLPYLKGKKVASIFKSSIGISPFRDEYAGQAGTILNDEFLQAYQGKKDINSALRDADERLNKYIAENPKK
jgi:multiple sugar transport system substrate-binding protein